MAAQGPDSRNHQRKAAVRTALALGVLALAIYAWAIISHL